MRATVVLPTYNEVDNIVKLVNEILAAIPPQWNREVLVVDDNSPDGTYRVAVEHFKDKPEVRAILRTANRGLAYSIREGVEAADGDFVVIMDTDFTHPPADLPRMLHIALVSDLVVGSRFCPGGGMNSIAHYLFSAIYNVLIRVVLRTQVQDNLSGFLVLSRRAIEQVRPQFNQIFYGYGDYCFRLIHYVQKARLDVLEMPVWYADRLYGESKSVFTKLLVSYTKALIQTKQSLMREARTAPRK